MERRANSDTELLSLRWNNHHSTIFEILTSLREKPIHSDVTLACSGKLFATHKLVLSACSPYFATMFASTQCQHPVVILKDISGDELEALLDYMYIGSVSVQQSALSSLIRAAECLQIKGLAVSDQPISADDAENGRVQSSTISSKGNSESIFASDSYDKVKTRLPWHDSLDDATEADFYDTKRTVKRKRNNEYENDIEITRNREKTSRTQSLDSGERLSEFVPSRHCSGALSNGQHLNAVSDGLRSLLGSPLSKSCKTDNRQLAVKEEPLEFSEHLDYTNDDASFVRQQLLLNNNDLSECLNEVKNEKYTSSDDPNMDEMDCVDLQMQESRSPITTVPQQRCNTDTMRQQQLMEASLVAAAAAAAAEALHPVNSTKTSSSSLTSPQLSSSSPLISPQGKAHALMHENSCSSTMDSLNLSVNSTWPLSRKHNSQSISTHASDIVSPLANALLDESCTLARYSASVSNRGSWSSAPVSSIPADGPFCCPYCGKLCKRKDHLRLHIRIHTGEKPFQCPYCDRRTNQKNNLKLHIRNVHPGQPVNV